MADSDDPKSLTIASRQQPASADRVPCKECPLIHCRGLSAPDEGQRAWIEAFKSSEARYVRGEQVLRQGVRATRLFTVLEGVLIRYRLLEDGRRQIVNFLFPGDLVGLQAAFEAELTHSVEAMTDVRLCVFPRDRFFDLAVSHPKLSFDLTWMAAREEAALEDHLVSLGQRNAQERLAYLAVFLVQRGAATGVSREGTLRLTVTQSQIADMLGLSLVHTNRSLQALRRLKLVDWTLSTISVHDMEAARSFAQMDGDPYIPRPYI
ncbi:Crp/Fnr family transcriptional regulator [Novosphingobium olei]|uniref:Crp/Fnr family transcriptional regulator n=1 Tax=Novosphingobium olei TaxID=2728851 RepID=A0A7Y0BS29_9SPHN|nr:Crp/Fnr family transcriptional regulator [Novosphingobium olei]NML95524.1 Crp/Fnr family transcriptional regulator [Novosphingobium olei]BEU99119.1 Crp/Fnr family transcriptional regulator [Novosphingobium olei]